MLNRLGIAIYSLAIVTALGISGPDRLWAAASPGGNGVVKVKSLYGFDETVSRLKADIAKKGIKFFSSIDQAQLAADSGIKLRPSRFAPWPG